MVDAELAEEPTAEQQAEAALPAPAEPPLPEDAPEDPTPPEGETADPLPGVVSQLSQRLGQRLERVLLARAGLLALVDRSDPDDAALAAELAQPNAPVVILDLQTYGLLQQMGQLVGTPSAAPLYERPQAPAVSPLLIQARRKLNAAKALLEQEMPDEALGLLCQALALALAVRAGLDAVPTLAAVAWVYSDLLPRGVVSTEEATVVARAYGLASAAAAPQALVEQIRGEVMVVVG